jgi:hypothetical protein
MIRIYWAKQPSVLVDEVLPLLLECGELTEEDIGSVFRKAGIGSYSESHIDLGVRVGLFKECGEAYILAADAMEDIRKGEGIRLFDFLRRVPHFNRWVEMKYVEEREIESADILIEDERGSQMRQDRSSLFSGWESQIQEKLETGTVRELVTDQDRGPVYVWDEYLFNKSQDNLPLRSAILCIIGAAAEQGAAIRNEDVAAILDVESEEVESVIDNVLKPVGCPLTAVGNAFTLVHDLRYIVAHPEPASNKMRTSIKEDFDFSSSSAIPELSVTIEKQGSHFIYPGIDQVSFDIERVSVLEPTPIYRFDTNKSDLALLDSLKVQTQRKSRVTAPVGLAEREDSLLTACRELLEAVEGGEPRGIDDRLHRHLRSRYEYLGAVPMLKPPSYEALTELGEKFIETNPTERWQLLQSIEFMCNPVLQSTLVLVERVDVAQRNNRWMASITGLDLRFGKLLADVLAHQGYEIVTGVAQGHRGATAIDFAMQLRMIEVDKRTHNLSIQEEFGKNLRSGELGIFPFFKEVEHEISNCLPEVVEA